MSRAKEILENIIDDFSPEKFIKFFREKNSSFVGLEENYSQYNDENFKNCIKLGEIKFSEGNELIICTFEVTKGLSERLGKKAQYDKAKKILKSNENQKYSAGIFIFYDNNNFRFSLIYPQSFGTRRQWNNFRRFTYFVSSEFTNKTFLKQIGENEFNDLDKIKSAFSITAVTDIFYDEFFKIYDKIVEATKKLNKAEDTEKVRDFILLFAIRTIFLGFIQKKKWIGDDEKFIQNFFKEYKNGFFGNNEFYTRWLIPLFFEALNSPQGRKVTYGNNDFSKDTEIKLQMAPYLNGGLFKSKKGYDDNSWIIPDKEIDDFFEFLFSHSFTIEENSLEDEDLQLNPEFLGIIFERLVNKADGAVYTPRTEVDLMCRLSLVKWLQKNLESAIKIENLYELFFKEGDKEEDQKEGSFSKKEAQEILEKLENISICDPAVGSGAFLVGMIQVLDDIEQILKNKYILNGKDIFERKKEIIKNCLYGVEVKEWAVWICHLRLWLSLFVDAPDDLKNSLDPILPSLDFKVRQGDSLVQRVGSKAFPISGHNLALSKSIKNKITKLKNLKLEYFDNKSDLQDWELKHTELAIYEEILEEEIQEKEKKLKAFKIDKSFVQQSFLENSEQSKQLKLIINQEQVKKIESEIFELKEQKQILRKGRKPLIWSIEFSEVFIEKNGFDIVIGNPPYVMYKSISDPNKYVKDANMYKSYLKEMVLMDYPNYFKSKKDIAGFSDLYIYFYIRGLRLINKSGVHCYVCSNFWLDVDYGVWLKKFLLDNTKIEFIINNDIKRSFSGAQINTIISIISPIKEIINQKALVKFITFKQTFEEVIYTENLLKIENATNLMTNNIFRVYPITIENLRASGMLYVKNTLTKNGKYIGDKWGSKYLKCPDFLIKILNEKLDKLSCLGAQDIATIQTGLKDAGYNKYLEPIGISNKNAKKIIRKPANFKSVSIIDGDYYINKNIKNHETVEYSPLLWLAMRGDRHICFYNMKRLPFTGNFFGIQPVVSENTLQFLGILNSTFNHLITEVFGRQGFGGGAIILVKSDLNNFPILDINKFNKEQMKSLASISNKYLNMEIKSIFEECGINPESNIPIEKQEPKPLPDRAELDNIIFDVLDLGDEERMEVYRAVCRLVWNRISKAKSV